MAKISIEKSINSDKNERVVKVENNVPYAKVWVNGRKYGNNETYKEKLYKDKEDKNAIKNADLNDGKKDIKSTDSKSVDKQQVAYVSKDSTKVSNQLITPTVVQNEVKKVEGNTKKEEKEKDGRSFWQRHPVLRVLLIVFLCLLAIGLLAIAAYHIMHAINNSKKNDEIDDAKKADEKVKKDKEKLTDEQKEKLEKGELKSEDIQKSLDKENKEAANAQKTKEQFDNYKNTNDTGEKAIIANNYAKSQANDLKDGKLDVNKLREVAEKENNDVTVANDAKDASYNNLTKDDKNGLTTYQAEQLKDNKDITVLNNKTVGGATKSDVDLYNEYKNAVSDLKTQFGTDTSTIQKIIDGDITSVASTWTDDQKTAFNTFSGVADNDNNIFSNTPNLTAAQRTAIHDGTFDVTKDNKFVASEQQQSLIDDYNAKVATLAQEKIEADYATKRHKYANNYQTVTDETEKSAALSNFEQLEKDAISKNNAQLSDYFNNKAASEANDVTQTQSLLDNVKNIENNQSVLDKVAGKTGATLADAQSAIENEYDNKFPQSDGWFRIAGDAAAAAGLAGLAGTGIAALIANSKDKKGKTVVKQNVDNGNADNNTKTITKTTTTTISK